MCILCIIYLSLHLHTLMLCVCAYIYIYIGLPGGTSGKEPACP